jgi:hypothetical protein
MSTFLLLIVQLLADMGVPMMRQLEHHLDDAPDNQATERIGPAGGGMTQARATVAPEYQKRPKEFDTTTAISNGF